MWSLKQSVPELMRWFPVLSGLSAMALAVGPAPPPSPPMTPFERQRLVAHLEMTGSWFVDEVSGLSQAQLDFKPSPDAWSIMQVIDHLVVVGPIYWKDLQAGVKGPAATQPSHMSDADVLWYGIDRTRREQAIPAEVPQGRLRNLGEALDAYRANHTRLLRYIETTDDDLRNRLVQRQRSDAYQWALLISTHEQRHILQIREVKAHRAFPRTARDR